MSTNPQNYELVGWVVFGLVLLVPGLGALGTMCVWVGRVATKAESANDRSHKLANDFMAYREYVAKEYVSKDVLGQMESRLISAVEKLGARIDKLFQSEKE